MERTLTWKRLTLPGSDVGTRKSMYDLEEEWIGLIVGLKPAAEARKDAAASSKPGLSVIRYMSEYTIDWGLPHRQTSSMPWPGDMQVLVGHWGTLAGYGTHYNSGISP